MQYVTPANGVARDLGNNRLGEASNLNLQVEHVQPSDALAGDVVVTDVAVVTADRLVAARAEGVGPGAGENNCAHRRIIASTLERMGQFEERLWSEGVASLGAIDRDARDPFGHFVNDVDELTLALPLGKGPRAKLVDGVEWGSVNDCLGHRHNATFECEVSRNPPYGVVVRHGKIPELGRSRVRRRSLTWCIHC
jgi:hypothetical protein